MSLTTTPLLAEGAVSMIKNHIQSNIAAELTTMRSMRDSSTTTEVPQSYFIYEGAKGYRCPAVFVICEDFDFQQSVTAANHINAVARVNVSIVVEERLQDLLTKKCWRYQSAIHRLLANSQLEDISKNIKLTVVVKKASFSPTYSNAANVNAPDAVFRKEVLFETECHQRENF